MQLCVVKVAKCKQSSILTPVQFTMAIPIANRTKDPEDSPCTL
jgi:hypothetical protein